MTSFKDSPAGAACHLLMKELTLVYIQSARRGPDLEVTGEGELQGDTEVIVTPLRRFSLGETTEAVRANSATF